MRKSAILAGLTVLIMGPIITSWIFSLYNTWILGAVPGAVVNINTPLAGNIWYDFLEPEAQTLYTIYTAPWNLWIIPAALALFYVGLKQNKQKVVTP